MKPESNPFAPGINVPKRFSELSFRFYEPFILEAVRRHPEVIAVDTISIGVAPETFASRYRDARRSYLSYHWPSAIDRKKFMEIKDEQVVSVTHNNGVLIGSKDNIKIRRFKPPVLSELSPLTPNDDRIPIIYKPGVMLDLPELEVLAYCLAEGIIKRRLQVTTEAELETLGIQYDIIIQDGAIPNVYLLI